MYINESKNCNKVNSQHFLHLKHTVLNTSVIQGKHNCIQYLQLEEFQLKVTIQKIKSTDYG